MHLDAVWTAIGLCGIALATWSVVRTLLARRVGADVLALLAIVGALAVHEALAAALITCMLATGIGLDARANARAHRSLRALVDRQPRTARRLTTTGIETVDVSSLQPGDVVVVATGGIVPVDGRALGPGSLLSLAEPQAEPRAPRRVAR